MKTTIVRLTMFCLNLIVISLVLAFQSYAKVDLESAAAIWLFDEGKGNEAKDFTGNGHDVALNGTEWVDGKFGKSLSFDGAKSNGKTPKTDAFALQDFTVCFFVNPKAQDEAIVALIDYSHTNCNWVVQSENAMSTKMWYLGYRGIGEVWQVEQPGQVPFTEGKWQHIVFVKADDKMLAYKDGVLVHTRTNADPKVKYEPYPLNFGGWYGTSRFFNGILDDVAIFAGALSEADIKDIATRGLIDAAVVSASGKLSIVWATIKVQY
ncbi:LamG domain-containing protein [Candidatus Poribacteria bacterium]|nr:LamG domain-containing protein [Candidatus Poribacteria bacterium]